MVSPRSSTQQLFLAARFYPNTNATLGLSMAVKSPVLCHQSSFSRFYSLALLLSFLLLGTSADMLSSTSPEPLRVHLHQEYLHYTVSLNIGGIQIPRLLVDTGSSDLVLRTDFPPYNPNVFESSTQSSTQTLAKDTEHNLYVDDRIVMYKQLSTSFATVTLGATNTTTTSVGTVTYYNSSLVLANEIDFNKDDWTILTNSWLNCSGVVGLGFPSRHDSFLHRYNGSVPSRNNTWSGLLINAVSPNLLAFSLDFGGDSVDNNQPTMWLGGVPSYYRSKLIWTEFNPIRPRRLMGTYNGRFVNTTAGEDGGGSGGDDGSGNSGGSSDLAGGKAGGEASASTLASSSSTPPATAASVSTLPIFQYPDDYYHFQMHDLNLCTVPLTNNVSSSWPVLLDSGAVCLALPSSLYDAVIAWLGSSVEEFGKDVWVPLVQFSSLPLLSFAVKQQTTSNQPRRFLHIPLGSLIYQRNKWMPPELCLIRSAETTQDFSGVNGLTYLQSSKIVFGSMVMKSFFIGVDMGNGRIALSNTKKAMVLVNASKQYGRLQATTAAKSQSRRPQCATKTVCIGSQSYYPPQNKCVSPKCSSFLFKALNTKTFVCEWDSGILAGFYFAVIALLLVELNSGVGHKLFVLSLSSRPRNNSNNATGNGNGNGNGNGDNNGMNIGQNSSSSSSSDEEEEDGYFGHL